MAIICVTNRVERIYFDTADVVKVEEPVDAAAGLKPSGWVDDCAAFVTLRSQHPVGVCVGYAEWPALKAALGFDVVRHVGGV